MGWDLKCTVLNCDAWNAANVTDDGWIFSKIHVLNGIRTCLFYPSEGSGFNGWFGSLFCSVVIPRQNKGVWFHSACIVTKIH